MFTITEYLTVLNAMSNHGFVMSDKENPLNMLDIRREHIVALHEAFTQTNKQKSPKRAQYLQELFQKLQRADNERSTLIWDDTDALS